MGIIESIGAAFAVLVAAIVYGIRKGAQREQGKQARQQARTVQQAKEVQRETDKTDTDSLRSELADKWVRRPPGK